MTKSFYEEPVRKTVREIADYCGCEFVGNGDAEVFGVETLKNAKADQLAFFHNKKYLNDLKATQSKVVILNNEYVGFLPDGATAILAKNVLVTYAKALEILYKSYEPETGISPHAVISKSAKIGPNATIGDFVVIEDGVEIGSDCFIDNFCKICKDVKIGNSCKISSNVSIKCAVLGDNVEIHAGAKIGEPGFGIVPDGSKMVKIKQLGRVVIGAHVRIGANTTIDRGSVGDTTIGDYTIIDNLVQIGHNVKIGKMVTLVSQVGIAGSSEIGDGAVLAGQVGVAGHISIGKGAIVASKSGVASSLPDGAVVGGIPAVDIMTWKRQSAFLKMSVKRKKAE